MTKEESPSMFTVSIGSIWMATRRGMGVIFQQGSQEDMCAPRGARVKLPLNVIPAERSERRDP
jgi:hypothetical protein